MVHLRGLVRGIPSRAGDGVSAVQSEDSRSAPFINLYAVTFLVGGAIYSALKYRKMPDMSHRVIGNWLIALGAILPGIGGSFTRFGHVEVLYVTELVGIVLIYFGFRFNVGGGKESAVVALEATT